MGCAPTLNLCSVWGSGGARRQAPGERGRHGLQAYLEPV